MNRLTKWYEENRIGFVDTLAERLGDERPDEAGLRWAITPSVVQHIGWRSSMYTPVLFLDLANLNQVKVTPNGTEPPNI